MNIFLIEFMFRYHLYQGGYRNSDTNYRLVMASTKDEAIEKIKKKYEYHEEGGDSRILIELSAHETIL